MIDSRAAATTDTDTRVLTFDGWLLLVLCVAMCFFSYVYVFPRKISLYAIMVSFMNFLFDVCLQYFRLFLMSDQVDTLFGRENKKKPPGG